MIALILLAAGALTAWLSPERSVFEFAGAALVVVSMLWMVWDSREEVAA